MYEVRLLAPASRELAALDRAVGRRIVSRLHWLAVHVADTPLEPLTGDVAGLFKLRVGAYRVVYEVLHGERTIIVHAIGHRRDIYRPR